jgi:Family of unknown function (DUF6011)
MEFKGQITDAKSAMKYMLAGKSFVTLVSLASGSRYTYKIELTDKRNPNDADAWFVSLLNGPDNWSNYQYIGLIRGGRFARTARSRVTEDAPSFIGFAFCFDKLSQGTIKGFEFWHEGKCGRCGRKLTVPESVAAGFGPECAGIVGGTPAVVTGTVAPQQNLNFDGSVRQPRKPAVKVQGVAAPIAPAPVAPKTFLNVGEIDAEIRRRIAIFQEDQETYTQDGELDPKQAFNVAYNKFRVEIEREKA